MNESLTVNEKLAYIAGLFDGEGCVSIHKVSNRQTYDLVVDVANQNIEILQVIKEYFGGSIREVIRGSKVYKISLSSNQALTFLYAVHPYVFIKRKQLEVAIEFQVAKHKRGKKRLLEKDLLYRDNMYLLLREMKKV